jgi:ABC-type multidrug transport system fused ATPase/permease subunit
MLAADVALDRARRLIPSRGARTGVLFLSLLEGTLLLALLGVLGLVLALLASHGETELDPSRAAAPPRWLRGLMPAPLPPGVVTLHDTGLSPTVVANDRSPVWPHRVFGEGLGRLVRGNRGLQANLSALAILLAWGLALLLALVGTIGWRRRLAIAAASGAAANLRRQIHRQIYRLGQSALPNEGIGPVVNLFSREVNDVRDALAGDLSDRVRLPLLAAVGLVVALLVSWPMTVFLVSLAALGVLVARPLLKATREEATLAARDAALQLCLLHEDLGLVRTVRVFGREEFDRDRFDDHLTDYQEAEARRMRTESSVNPTLLLLVGVAAALGLGLVGYAVVGNEDRHVSLASALIVSVAVGLAAWFLSRATALRATRRRGGRSAATVFDYLDRRPELLMNPGARFLPPMKDRIALEHVTLRTPSGRTILDDVSTAIPAGTRTAILGVEESGRQAILCLLPRLIDPTSGRVLIDGVDLRDVTLESLRAQVSTIFQADLVFSDTVAANIALDDPSYTLPRMVEAAKVAHAHHFIQALPQGYDTLIGPLGHPLTPDEQYRIALARAFLHDPSIVLIEEPNAAIDDDIKPLIDDTIDRLGRNRTLLFLPRRLSTIRRCQNVLVLNNGKLEDAGPPRELTRRSRLFRHLQYIQFNQFATGEPEPALDGG